MDENENGKEIKVEFPSPEKTANAGYPGDIHPDELPPIYDDEIPREAGRSLIREDLAYAVKLRYMEVARLAAQGKSPKQIAGRVGYSPHTVRRILADESVRTEVQRYRDRLFDNDIVAAMKDMGPDAIKVLQLMVNSEGEKLKDRVEAAKWLLEKLTGKAKQEHAHESNTLVAFMEMMQKMQNAGQTLSPAQQNQPETIDVTPKPAENSEEPAPNAPSKWQDWSKNI